MNNISFLFYSLMISNTSIVPQIFLEREKKSATIDIQRFLEKEAN